MMHDNAPDGFVARDGETFHPLMGKDGIAVAAMRVATAMLKGKMGEPAARGPFDAVMRSVPAPAGVTYESGVFGGVSGVLCRPENGRSESAILYLHGGAYVLGSADAYQHFAGQIAARTEARTLVVDYRRAPESPFPAAVDDTKAAYRAIIADGAKAIAIAGDSAGGGLTLALLSILQGAERTGDSIAPCAAVAMSPWTDLALTGASMVDRAEADPLATKDMLAAAAQLYLNGHDAKDPRASPLYAMLSGLPAVQVHVGGDEVLLDDSRRYVERARKNKVDASVHVWEGMMHVFPSNLGKLAAADAAMDMICTFLSERLHARSEAGRL